jgi:hypothetical protein
VAVRVLLRKAPGGGGPWAHVGAADRQGGSGAGCSTVHPLGWWPGQPCNRLPSTRSSTGWLGLARRGARPLGTQLVVRALGGQVLTL